MKHMKIFYLAAAFALLTCPSMATTMCAADDTVSVVLDPLVAGTNHSYNTELFEWSATFPFGTVWGIATCVETTGKYGVAADGDLIDSATGDVATGGERTGPQCWCQMTHPLLSRWVFRETFASVDSCRSDCANYCGYYVRSSSAMRGGVFGSVGD
ncbi:hypothetical protein HDR61_00225 [bacterium]|nr:hypothetical protein [bacterium]